MFSVVMQRQGNRNIGLFWAVSENKPLISKQLETENPIFSENPNPSPIAKKC